MNQHLINSMVTNWKQFTTNYDLEDLREYKTYLDSLSESKLQEMVNRTNYFNSKECKRFVNTEINKMTNAGMFN